MSEGVLVASDITQEWLLPWWWHHYQKHNDSPVAFIDLGLSFEKKKWCQSRGTLLPLRLFPDFVKEKPEIDPTVVAHWENLFGDHFWASRASWFQKPFACLISPFEKTLWIDLDCEIHASIKPLFSYTKVAIAKDQTQTAKKAPFPIYNSGVISFPKKAKLISDWAASSKEMNHLFAGDQDVLSHLITQDPDAIAEIPPLYNWSRTLGDHPKSVITHWHGPPGKFVIRTKWAALSQQLEIED